ncbi:hypothetical protein NCG89_14160 [Spongiibacter taiwanensis]|uniref:hypothetical protein n=1 Tax=Spongiibacter taiwanensis TaxID=1748242 RepID=UPI002035EEE2|nr:hypothetical protein [Spongiibacter taiwanensis]USA42675.1 hypothetical protein NCG89_14160 [Spongiibacter taiwanensis]
MASLLAYIVALSAALLLSQTLIQLLHLPLGDSVLIGAMAGLAVFIGTSLWCFATPNAAHLTWILVAICLTNAGLTQALGFSWGGA